RAIFNLAMPFGALLAPALDRETFDSVVRTGKPAVQRLKRGPLTGLHVGVRVPIIRNGQVKYVLTALIDPGSVKSVLQGQPLAAGWVAAVLDQDKTMIALTRDTENLLGQKTNTLASQIPVNAAYGWISGKNSKGVQSYAAFHKSELAGWSIIVAIPAAVLDWPLYRSIAGISLLGILALVVGVVLARLVARGIESSVKLLTGLTAALGRGQRMVDIPHSNILEVNRVTGALEEAAQLLEYRASERDRVENALRESERRFHGLADAVPILVWEVDANKSCTYVNKPWLDFTGRSLEQELGEGWPKDVHLEDFDRCVKIFTEAFDRRGTFQMEYRLRFRDGSYRWVAVQGRPVFSQDGNFKGYVGGCIDITSQKNVEQELRVLSEELERRVSARTVELKKANERLFRQAELLDLTHDAIVVREFAGGRIVFWNDGAVKMYGWSSHEVINVNSAQLLKPIYPQDPTDIEAKVLSDGRWEGEVTHSRKDGSRITVLSRWSLRNEADGSPAGILELNSDITEKKDAEKKALQAERLATLGATVAVFAHEVGNPLNGITLSLQLALQQLRTSPEDQAAIVSSLEDGVREIDRLAELLQEFRSLARPPSLRREPSDLSKLIHETLAPEMPIYRAAAIKVDLQLDGPLPAVSVDAQKMKQVFLNLTKNAFEAMTSGGALVIRAYGSSDQVVVEISDTGPGVADGINIFEPFQTTKSSGTGLGLTVVRKIVSAHGGSIDCVSEKNKGTTFKLSLPIC
ncbi:MAG: PAS domain S-box protein, partial [Candidatus Binatia bacterium]